MVLKVELSKDEFDGLDEELNKLYIEKDGVFQLYAEIEDLSGLKSTLEKERASGENIIYGKDTSKPVDMVEWISSRQPEAPHLFKPSGGGGATGNATAANGKTIHLTPVEAKDPARYRAAKGQAAKIGGTIPPQLP
jgi:hypothetical protein